jgi:elongator complex protein 3
MKDKGDIPSDIRQREVKLGNFDPNNCNLFVTHYEGSGGDEYFISYESRDKKTLYGFFRLRLNKYWDETMDHIKGHALGRELHVYGEHTNVGHQNSQSGTQHRGLGSKLLKIGEEIAFRSGFKEISIISGIGVREYYRKKGYHLNHTYMTKSLSKNMFPCIMFDEFCFYMGVFLLIFSIFCSFKSISMAQI